MYREFQDSSPRILDNVTRFIGFYFLSTITIRLKNIVRSILRGEINKGKS